MTTVFVAVHELLQWLVGVNLSMHMPTARCPARLRTLHAQHITVCLTSTSIIQRTTVCPFSLWVTGFVQPVMAAHGSARVRASGNKRLQAVALPLLSIVRTRRATAKTLCLVMGLVWQMFHVVSRAADSLMDSG